MHAAALFVRALFFLQAHVALPGAVADLPAFCDLAGTTCSDGLRQR
jgi:hypothetical protein